MEETILQAVLQEMKGLRQDVGATNQRLDFVVDEAKRTNQRLDFVVDEAKRTNQRLDQTIGRLDGLHESFLVLQDGIAGMRRDLQAIKEIRRQSNMA
jgi:outer membrane murein-binding lipoprotein Lpp